MIGAGAWLPPEISPGAWSPGIEPSALEVRGGEMGRPEPYGQSLCTLSKRAFSAWRSCACSIHNQQQA